MPSTRFCRPLAFMFQKETKEAIILETERFQSQIRALTPTMVTVEGKELIVTHELFLTMIDGKVANALTGTKSTHTCYVCGCTPKQRKNLSEPPPDTTENYAFGLATLHARIRLFEFLLSIAYTLDLGKRPRTPDDKASADLRKKLFRRVSRKRFA